MKRALETFPFFLVAIPAFFLLYNNNYYFGLLEWSRIGMELFIYIIIPPFLWLLFWWLFASWQKAGIMVAVLLVLFYFFQPIHDFLKALAFLHFNFIARYVVLIPLLCIGVVILLRYLRRSRKSFTTLHAYINLLFIVLVIFEIAGSLYNTIAGNMAHHDLADSRKRLSKRFKACDTCLTPDIYFFIFDEYTSHPVLQSEFNYNNEGLLSDLRSKGFYIADSSRSNYNFTNMSIASILNLDYLQSVRNGKRYYARDLLKANYTIYRNELCTILKKQGYTIENFSLFDIDQAPTHVSKPYQDQYMAFILEQTMLTRIRKDIGWNFLRTGQQSQLSVKEREVQDQDVQRLKETREGVMNIIRSPKDQPRFVYAHFLIPHPPFYYDSTGRRLPPTYSAVHLGKADYLQQLVYANKFIIKPVMDSIFRLSKKPFLIILQGDHGYRNYASGKEALEMYNLNAVYFPGGDYKLMYKNVSSVNTFRVVLNKFFSAGLPLLPDSSFYLLHQEQ